MDIINRMILSSILKLFALVNWYSQHLFMQPQKVLKNISRICLFQ